MAVIIPIVPGEPEQRLAIALDNEPYVLRVRWNTRDNAWYLDAWERDGKTPIAYGLKLVLGVLLGRTVPHPLFAAGMFLVPADPSDGREAGLNDLGGRINLVHLTTADAVVLRQPPP